MISITNKKAVLFSLSLLLMYGTTHGQFLKKKAKKNKFECGYVHKKTLKERLNVGTLVGGVVTKFLVKGSDKFEFDNTAVTISRSNHIYPQGYVDMPFKIDGWEACGTSIGALALSKYGLPLIKIPYFSIDGTTYKPAAMGQYFEGFPHTDQNNKEVAIKDNNGKELKLNLKPMEGFKIKTVNGIQRWDTSLAYDGTEDMVIELDNNIDPNAKLGVELHNKVTGVRFNSPVFFSVDKNTLTIPKEAFRNSLKFIEDNMLIVYKYKETLLDDQAVGNGALRVVDSYYDFTPIQITGKLNNSIFSKMWKKENQKVEQKDLSKVTKYDFEFKKGDPLYYAPSSEIKKIAVPSFVVRGNLKHKHVDVETTSFSSTNYNTGVKTTTTNTTTKTFTKWFPKLEKDTWQNLADKLYIDFEKSLEESYQVPVVDVKKIIATSSYKKVIPILDTVTKNFVEVGAFGTQRVLPSIKNERANLTTTGNKTASQAEQAKAGGSREIQINTFPSDFVTSRIMNEFGANCAITVNFDLEFDIQAEALLPIVSIRFYAPSTGSNQMSYYHEIQAYYKESISLKEAKKIEGSAVDQIYGMIDAPQFFLELKYTIDKIMETEKENQSYQKMWNAMH